MGLQALGDFSKVASPTKKVFTFQKGQIVLDPRKLETFF
jgi:hypothetical protein